MMEKIMRSELINACEALTQRATELRCRIHANPELGCKEFATSALVMAELKDIGIEYRSFDDGYTGVIGIIHGGKPGPVIGMRADMDALPIQEFDLSKSYSSNKPGVMHACGHDVHTAVLLGAARIIHGFKDRLAGTVKLIFQPAEEASEGGADEMVRRGCLENPHVDEIFGIHVDDQRDCGMVGTRVGATNASCDSITITVQGKSAHGTRPELGVDALYAACQVVTNLHAMLSRRVGALKNVSLNIGTLHAGTASNIIADTAVMNISLRTTDPAMRPYMFSEIERTAKCICEACCAEAKMEIRCGSGSVVNDRVLVEHVKGISELLLGEGHFNYTEELCIGSEDFSHYTESIPGCFYDIGIRNRGKGIDAPLHNCHFDIDERAIGIGLLMQSGVVLSRLCTLTDDGKKG